MLILELLLICVSFEPPDGSTDETSGGGRRSAGGGGGGDEGEMTLDFSWEAIPLVSTLLMGLMASVLTAIVVLICCMVFKWGNSRMSRCAVVRGSLVLRFVWEGVGVQVSSLVGRRQWAK